MSSGVLRRVLLRSFFLQGAWNFERMQNLGFCCSILPVLRDIYLDGEELKESLKRHLEFFNTHPYMASPIIGAVARMEEEAKIGTMSREDIRDFKTGIMGPFGAIGDSFFWGALKPFASLIGVSIAAMDQLIAPVVFFAVYNIPHIKMRVFGLYSGYSEGPDVIERFSYKEKIKKVKFLIVIIAGALLAIVAHLKFYAVLPGVAMSRALWILVLFSGFYWLVKRGISIQALVYISFSLSIGLSVII